MGLKALVTSGYERPGGEDWRSACDQLIVLTSGVVPGGLRLQTDPLSEEDQADVVRLLRKATGGDDGAFKLGKRDLASLERLAEKGAGRESGSVFEAAREAQELSSKFAELHRDLVKPKRRVRLEEPGSVTLPALWVHGWFTRPRPVLYVRQLGLLTLLMGCFEAGSAEPFRNGRLEGVGADCEIVIDRRTGPGLHLDQEDRISSWLSDLDHLEKNGFVNLNKSASEVRVRRGKRLLKSEKRAA